MSQQKQTNNISLAERIQKKIKSIPQLNSGSFETQQLNENKNQEQLEFFKQKAQQMESLVLSQNNMIQELNKKLQAFEKFMNVQQQTMNIQLSASTIDTQHLEAPEDANSISITQNEIKKPKQISNQSKSLIPEIQVIPEELGMVLANAIDQITDKQISNSNPLDVKASSRPFIENNVSEHSIEDSSCASINRSKQNNNSLLESSLKTNQQLFSRISNLVQEQNRVTDLQLKDAQNYRENIRNQEKINESKIIKKSDFYCQSCKIPFSSLNTLTVHNDKFHKDNQFQKDSQSIRFTCRVCEISSFQSKDACLNHQQHCLKRYIEMINAQEGIEVLSLKNYSQEERGLIQLAQKVLKKNY